MSTPSSRTSFPSSYLVHLTYFRRTGKYHSEGTFTTAAHNSLDTIWGEVEALRASGKLPGLAEGCGRDCIILVRSDHPHDHPRLLT